MDDDAASVLDAVNAAFSAEDLADLNAQSVNDQKSADVIAEDWLTENDLLD